ncbi:26S proteasome non-ATPase regulatory subunit 11-like protein [Psilocybe cubensis]|uniref:26S proteasome non-ATPase regulatory subunit 11-like protein n=1 Tax=Psilocybe cubensis TaxID=181762 RepID=A0ACB8GJS2_PSICU|nr:26S proteasome non-ATPase regulatory subunit 11-like protein [Psilocybe cubensis]KAH9475642.1 26S proteasome non-ATPase regulatory subunit 11-like protein [Psilocybe cubensis]
MVTAVASHFDFEPPPWGRFDLRFGRPVNIEQRGLVTESPECSEAMYRLPASGPSGLLKTEYSDTTLSTPTQRIDFPRAADLPNLYIECLNTPAQRIDFPRAVHLLFYSSDAMYQFPANRHLPNLYIKICTAASSIYGPPYLQSQTDMQSCILHAKGKDYSTVSSSFFEAFKNLSAAGMKDSSAAGGKVQDKEEKARAKEVGGDTKNEQG